MADSQPLSGAPEGAEYLRAVLRAPVYEAAQVTPLQKMEKLSSRLDNVILVKREDRQPVHSFKLRGAYAMMAGLTEEQRAGLRGVLSCDPRPRYQEDPERVYGLAFAGKNVKFTVQNGVLTVLAVED